MMLKDKTKLKRYFADYYRKNKEHIQAKSKEWSAQNRERRVELSLQWARGHPFRRWCIGTLAHHKKRFRIQITLDELEFMVKLSPNCFYCDEPMSYGGTGKVVPATATLDRMANADYLSVGNVRIICHLCNTSKRERTHDEFVEYCSMIKKKFRGET